MTPEEIAAAIGEELDNTPHKNNAEHVEHFTRLVAAAIREAETRGRDELGANIIAAAIRSRKGVHDLRRARDVVAMIDAALAPKEAGDG